MTTAQQRWLKAVIGGAGLTLLSWLLFGCTAAQFRKVYPCQPDAINPLTAKVNKVVEVAAPMVVVPPAKPFTIGWTPSVSSNCVTEIWSSADLLNWQLKFTTNGAAYSTPMNDKEFFKIRAMDTNTGVTSEWSGR